MKVILESFYHSAQIIVGVPVVGKPSEGIISGLYNRGWYALSRKEVKFYSIIVSGLGDYNVYLLYYNIIYTTSTLIPT